MTNSIVRHLKSSTATGLLTILGLASGIGCSSDDGGSTSSQSTGCVTDSDCKGDRVCKDKECVEPQSSGSSGSGSGGSGMTANPSGGQPGAAGSIALPSAGSGSGGSTPAPMCTPAGQACKVNGDCCDFAASNTGALCVGSVCAATCTAPGDCNSGCCASLEGTSTKACAPASVCETAVDPACLDGVVYFCACGAAADVPCTAAEIDNYAAVCAAGDPQDIFTCIGTRGEPANLDQCLASLQACD